MIGKATSGGPTKNGSSSCSRYRLSVTLYPARCIFLFSATAELSTNFLVSLGKFDSTGSTISFFSKSSSSKEDEKKYWRLAIEGCREYFFESDAAGSDFQKKLVVTPTNK